MPVSAFDLPQLWQKPPAADLLQALHSLRLEPPVWNLQASRADILKHHDTTVRHHRDIAAYLSTIIKSQLAWLDDQEAREAIWAEAGKRFSERCGRSAMGEITRRWPFAPKSSPPFDLVVREPPLTGDNLGLKTWGSSYALAQMLETIAQQSLSHLLGPYSCSTSSRPTVLELGSGTGLLGLAAATIWQTHVLLSDLPEIMPNLAHNLDKNRAMIEASGGSVESGALTWGGEEDEIDPFLFVNKNTFKIVIVADPLYDDEHPGLLAGAVDEQLALGQDARAMIMVPQRDATAVKLLADFRGELAAKTNALVCLEETVVAGQDDWGGDHDEDSSYVNCWLGIFGRQLAH